MKDTKVCLGCKEDLHVIAFGKPIVAKTGRLYPRPRCKPCTSAGQKKRTMECRLEGYPRLYKRCKCGGVITLSRGKCSGGCK